MKVKNLTAFSYEGLKHKTTVCGATFLKFATASFASGPVYFPKKIKVSGIVGGNVKEFLPQSVSVGDLSFIFLREAVETLH